MKIIGHRGARGLAPENTLASIEAGIAAGVDMIEIDVRVTRDNVPVLHHDPTVDDLADFAIREHSLQELLARQSDVPTLGAAIAAVNRRVPLIVEIKRGADPRPITDLLQTFLDKEWAYDDFFVASFDYKILQNVHQQIPELRLVVLDRWSGVRASHRARRLGTKFICMKQQFLWSGFIKSMAKSGYHLSTYTLNDPAKAARWARHGLYGVVTDFPDRFKAIKK